MTATEYLIDSPDRAVQGPRRPTSAARHRIKQGFRSGRSNPCASVSVIGPEAISVAHAGSNAGPRRQTRTLDADESDRLYRVARRGALPSRCSAARTKRRPPRRRPGALNGRRRLICSTPMPVRRIEDISDGSSTESSASGRSRQLCSGFRSAAPGWQSATTEGYQGI